MAMRTRFGGVAFGLAASALVLFADTNAIGRSSYDSPYGYDRTWNAALRLVRVDLGLKVVEKDDVNGFLLFEYRPAGNGRKSASGSFEVIRGSGRSGRPDDVRVIVELPSMPRAHEQVLLDELGTKMRAEYGEPPEPRPAPVAPPTPSAPDAGTENDEH
jgi:hypothetical protein